MGINRKILPFKYHIGFTINNPKIEDLLYELCFDYDIDSSFLEEEPLWMYTKKVDSKMEMM